VTLTKLIAEVRSNAEVHEGVGSVDWDHCGGPCELSGLRTRGGAAMA